MVTRFSRPESLQANRTHYCAGCGHGIMHRIIAECVDELGIRDKTICIAPVGCAVLAYDYFNFDVSEAAHGRTPAVATGMKRMLPDRVVFTYQGDGDLAAIGTAEIVHAANRGENISVFFINNAVYGMTKGQMAPTSWVGQKTTTTPLGRDPVTEGCPVRVCELLNALERPAYLARTALCSPKGVRETKRAVLKAFQAQIDGRGFTLVEALSPCPTHWRMSPAQSMEFIEKELTKTFPLGVVRELGQ